MPTPPTAKWPKPKSEDEFEEISVDFLRLRWQDPNAARNGRRGQRQHGVDIIGHPGRLDGKTAGAQCKNSDRIKLSHIVAEVEKAKGFPGGLGELLIVTSGEREGELQGLVREHFRKSPVSFGIEIVFWNDIVAQIAQDDALVKKHWKGWGPNANRTVVLIVAIAIALLAAGLVAVELGGVLKHQPQPSLAVSRFDEPRFDGSVDDVAKWSVVNSIGPFWITRPHTQSCFQSQAEIR
jgi:hypothetical protein